jgi:DNA-binding HxlR family transcriptional regulator
MDRPWVLGYETRNCTIEAALAVVGDRGSFLVLREAFNGVRRFGDMQRRTGLPRQILSNLLRALTEAGLLRKTGYQEPGQRQRGEYRLTRKGMDLFPVLVALLEWGGTHAAGPDGPLVELRHADCGAPVRLALTCSAGVISKTTRPGSARASVKSSAAVIGGRGVVPSTRLCRNSRPLSRPAAAAPIAGSAYWMRCSLMLPASGWIVSVTRASVPGRC